MKALSEKWPVVERVALDMGMKKDTIRKWRERGVIPGAHQIKLINASKRKLAMADFMEEEI